MRDTEVVTSNIIVKLINEPVYQSISSTANQSTEPLPTETASNSDQLLGIPQLTAEDQQHEFNRDKTTWVGYLLIGYYCLSLSSMGPIVPFLRDEQQLNYTVSSFHFSAWALGGILAGLFGRLIIRKFGCSLAIWVCGVGVAVAITILLAMKSAVFTIGAGVIGGACGSTMGQGIVSVMSERFGSNRSIGLTEANIFGSLFAFVAPLLVGQCIQLGFNWRVAMLVPLAMYCLLWLTSRKTFSAFSAAATEGFASGALPLRYWFFWFVIWFSVASEWSIMYWTSEFLEKGKGLIRQDAIQAISIFLLTMLLGRIAGLKLARRFDLGKLLTVVSVVAVAGFLTYWLGPNPQISLIGLAVTGLGMSNLYPLSFSQAIGAAEGKAGLAAGRMSISTGTAVLTTPLAMGAIGDRFGITNSYAIIAVLLTLAMILLAVASVRKQPEAS